MKMDDKNYDIFFDFVGNDGVAGVTSQARESDKTCFVESMLKIADENYSEYENVRDEMENLAEEFWELCNN